MTMPYEWPFVRRKTYKALLGDFNSMSDHYWRQFSKSINWEKKYKELEKKYENLKRSVDENVA